MDIVILAADCDGALAPQTKVAHRRCKPADIAAEPRIRNRRAVVNERDGIRSLCSVECDIIGGAHRGCHVPLDRRLWPDHTTRGPKLRVLEPTPSSISRHDFSAAQYSL